MMYAYTVYGLTLHICFPCPTLSTADFAAPPDVVMREGDVPRSLPAPVVGDTQWQAEAQRYLWSGGRRSGRFLAEDGQRVTLCRHAEADENTLACHFVGFVLVALLRQRGLLVLHAGAVVTPSGAVAVSGRSGAGKSTTTAALLAHGCALLADDVTALAWGAEGSVQALPGVQELALCGDAAQRLGQNREQSGISAPVCSPARAKFVVRPLIAPPRQEIPLRAIYLLQVQAHPAVRLRALSGAERFRALQECLYGPLLPEEHPCHFAMLAHVAEHVAIYRVERPADAWTVEDVAGAMLRG